MEGALNVLSWSKDIDGRGAPGLFTTILSLSISRADLAPSKV